MIGQAISLLLSLCSFSMAEVDRVERRLIEQLNVPLRWDNVEGPPYWVDGVKPVRKTHLGLHVIPLPPNNQCTLRVPPRVTVRIEAIEAALNPQEVELWIDNGTGLAVRHIPALSSDGRSLVCASPSLETSIVHLVRPAHAESCIELAVFLSRREIPREIAPYRHQLDAGSLTAQIRRDDEPDTWHFSALDPGVPCVLRVEGPARLCVQTRLRFRPLEAAFRQSYHVAVSLDGQLHKHLEFETSAEYRHRLRVNGTEQLLGRLERGFIDIPSGGHTLELDSTAALYLRVMAQKESDYLMPAWNGPPLAVREVWQEAHPFANYVSPWQLLADEMNAFAPHDDQFPMAVEQIAWRSARDNRYRGGGIQGSCLLREAALLHPDVEELGTLATEFQAYHTFYRDLHPFQNSRREAHYFAWFVPRRLLAVDERARESVLSETHLDDVLSRLSGGTFVMLGDTRETAQVYRPPHDRGTSFLRVVVDLSTVSSKTPIFVQLDGRHPLELLTGVDSQRPLQEFATSLADAGLVALRERHPGTDAGTLGGPFGQFGTPARCVKAGTAVVLMPADVSEVRVWSPDGARTGVRVAIQVQSSRPFRLSESQYCEFRQRTGSFFSQHNFVHGSMPATFDEQELFNHWTPIRRNLISKSRWYELQVTHGRQPTRQETVQSHAPEIDRARQRMQQEQWLVALEALSQALPYTAEGSSLRRESLLARTQALDGLGEAFLSERQLRGLALHRIPLCSARRPSGSSSCTANRRTWIR
jgi:hypothetical protein